VTVVAGVLPCGTLDAVVGAALAGALVVAGWLGAVDPPPPEQAANAIDASRTSVPRRLGVVVTR